MTDYGNITWTPELRQRLRELVRVELTDCELITAQLQAEFHGRNFTVSKIKSAISNFGLKLHNVRHTNRRGEKLSMSEKDPRIVYGARCLWWDTIDKIDRTPNRGDGIRLPCCPHCGNVLYEMPNMEAWVKGLEAYEKNHPGYRVFLDWLRGKCFPTMFDAKIAYKQDTGIELAW